MKHGLATVILICWATATWSAEPGCRITDFGILESAKPVEVKADTGAATGAVRFFKPVPIQERTDRIPTRIGVRFGVKHEFLDIPAEGRLIAVVTHPPMVSPSGEIKSVTRVAKNPRDVGSAYGFDHPRELLPGQWLFQFEFDGKLLCEKSFTVVAD